VLCCVLRGGAGWLTLMICDYLRWSECLRHRMPGALQRLGYLGDRDLARGHPHGMPLVLRRQLRPTSPFAATRPCCSQPRHDPCLNQRSLILGHSGNQLESKPAVRRGRVARHPSHTLQADAAVLQIRDDLQ
jgi:hypothetical protein